jgi:hypothetical protein
MRRAASGVVDPRYRPGEPPAAGWCLRFAPPALGSLPPMGMRPRLGDTLLIWFRPAPSHFVSFYPFRSSGLRRSAALGRTGWLSRRLRLRLGLGSCLGLVIVRSGGG